MTDQKLNNAKLTTQLDYSLESSKVIEKNVVAYKQEINALRTKAEQYSNLVAKVRVLDFILDLDSLLLSLLIWVVITPTPLYPGTHTCIP